MKTTNAWKSALLLTTLIFTQAALAITPAEETEKKCIKPKFRDFLPPHKSEVAPETEISFHINRFADPEHVKATAKKIPMKGDVVNKQTFYIVKAKLPAELRDGFARIHIEARSTEGDCIGQDGWLVKIVDTTSKSELTSPVEESTEAATETSSTPAKINQ